MNQPQKIFVFYISWVLGYDKPGIDYVVNPISTQATCGYNNLKKVPETHVSFLKILRSVSFKRLIFSKIAKNFSVDSKVWEVCIRRQKNL
jgi:hypothetical protein